MSDFFKFCGLIRYVCKKIGNFVHFCNLIVNGKKRIKATEITDLKYFQAQTKLIFKAISYIINKHTNAVSFYGFKNLYTFCTSPKSLCPAKKWFLNSKFCFCAGTKIFEEAQNAVKFLGWLKKFEPAQNILGPVKGQGINAVKFLGWLKKFGPAQNILRPVKGQGISDL